MKADEVVQLLNKLYHEHMLAHAYLFETNNIQKCNNDLKKLIKMISCPKEYQDKCQKCSLCNLIDNDSLPSLMVVNPDGKFIKKDSIEAIKNNFALLPTYTTNNFYIINYPEKRNDTAYNKMLKFLEEPEDGIIGFFVSSNKSQIASTILSRLECIKIIYSEDEIVKNYNHEELLKEYINKIETANLNILWYNCNVLLKSLTEKIDVVEFMQNLLNIYLNFFHGNSVEGIQIKPQNIIQKINLISKYLEKLNYNVNSSLLLDSFAIEIIDLNNLSTN